MAYLLKILVDESRTEKLPLFVPGWPLRPEMRALVTEIVDRVESCSQNFFAGLSLALNFPNFAMGNCNDYCLYLFVSLCFIALIWNMGASTSLSSVTGSSLCTLLANYASFWAIFILLRSWASLSFTLVARLSRLILDVALGLTWTGLSALLAFGLIRPRGLSLVEAIIGLLVSPISRRASSNIRERLVFLIGIEASIVLRKLSLSSELVVCSVALDSGDLRLTANKFFWSKSIEELR